MLNPVLILCVVAWFLAAGYLFVAIDLSMLDTDESALRENAARLESNGLQDLAALDRQELLHYPRQYTAIMITTLFAVFALIGAILLGVRKDWRDNLSTASRVAISVTFAYLLFLTVQSWVTTKIPMVTGVAVADILLALSSFTLLLVSGVKNETV